MLFQVQLQGHLSYRVVLVHSSFESLKLRLRCVDKLLLEGRCYDVFEGRVHHHNKFDSLFNSTQEMSQSRGSGV